MLALWSVSALDIASLCLDKAYSLDPAPDFNFILAFMSIALDDVSGM